MYARGPLSLSGYHRMGAETRPMPAVWCPELLRDRACRVGVVLADEVVIGFVARTGRKIKVSIVEWNDYYQTTRRWFHCSAESRLILRQWPGWLRQMG